MISLITVLFLTRFNALQSEVKPDLLLINEFVAANNNGLQDADGDFSDWLEIYNPGPNDISLAGWYLTDDVKQPEKWAFPPMVLNTDSYLLVFASGKNRRDPNLDLHTNFRLNRAGDSLALYNVMTNDWITHVPQVYPPQFRDIAYGRYGLFENGMELVYGYFEQATPGQANPKTPTWRGLVEPIVFSHQRGFYDEPFTLTLSTATTGTSIIYTTDGRLPSLDTGQIYQGPLQIDKTTPLRAIALKPGYKSRPAQAHTYLFPAQIITQPAAPPGFPAIWGTFSGSYWFYEKGQPVPADYEMDPEIALSPRYQTQLLAGLEAIPSLSIALDIADFDIYAHPRERGLDWERRASIEWLAPDGDEGFQINAGLRIQGNKGRREYILKHSFRLFFREVYGTAKLTYPIFADSAVETFNTFILRSGTNRSYAGFVEDPEEQEFDYHRLSTYMRDEWYRQTQREMSGLSSHGTFVHLYINGLYWGLYNLVEKYDSEFALAYLGAPEEAWGVLDKNGQVDGDITRFDELHELIAQGGFDDPQQYAKLESYLDVSHFIDYVILNWYAGNQDWGHTNWYAIVKNPNGRVLYFAWDGEVTWLEGMDDELGDYVDDEPNRIQRMFRSLLVNQDFRMLFTDRMYKHLFNDGALTDAKAQARWQALANTINTAIVAESARWGDTWYEDPITHEDWLKAKDDVLAQMAGNGAKMLTSNLDDYGRYPNFNPPNFSQHGGLIEPGFALTLAPLTGTVYFTTDNSDPREAITGHVAPTAQIYQEPLVLTQSIHIKVRAKVGEQWGALNEATFVLTPQDMGLRITELMYNPPGGQAYEFVELTNISFDPLDLGGSRFAGIIFTFPDGLPPLRPQQSLVLARNPQAFAQRYPEVKVDGTYQGQLSNSGETISLSTAEGMLITAVSYDDEQGWPLSPDGRGDSLNFINLQGDPDNPTNWQASLKPLGSPGLVQFEK